MSATVLETLIYKVTVELEDSLAQLALLTSSTDKIERTIGNLSRKEQMLNDIRGNALSRARELAESTVRFRKDMHFLNDAVLRGTISWYHYRKAVKEVRTSFWEAGVPLAAMASKLNHVGRTAVKVGTRPASAPGSRSLPIVASVKFAGLSNDHKPTRPSCGNSPWAKSKPANISRNERILKIFIPFLLFCES